MSDLESRHDFIIVGSGAGGGLLAANLAEAGFTVLLLEAGGEHVCPYYQVPVMQARASEDEDMRWDFFVRHYGDREKCLRDPKYVEKEAGVLYPRGATLDGSTAVSAMITLYPSNSDWDDLASLTGNDGWNADAMRRRFERIESWRGPDPDPAHPARPGDGSRHGSDGWLPISRANPKLASREPWFLEIINAIDAESRATYHTPESVVLPNDPNDWRFVDDRAVSVAYLFGARLYMGYPNAAEAHGPGSPQKVYARYAVILSGGAYNTPQLLMLSGIGPRAELERHGITVRLDRPGVGANLQDRYEICVVNRMIHDYAIFKDQTLDVPGCDGKANSLFTEWDKERSGPYSTNGSLAAFVARSSVAGDDSDLYVMALPIDFHGYYAGYAVAGALDHDRLTLLVLKAHTQNHDGKVTLASTDPRDCPLIDFHYFEEGTDIEGKDMQGLLEGVAIARRISARLDNNIADEMIPGKDTAEQGLREWVHDNAWGHHAFCTCKIGTEDDPQAVLDGDFRVHGVHGLRVVDASFFPRIPGIFICSAVYMVSERASDVPIREYSKKE